MQRQVTPELTCQRSLTLLRHRSTGMPRLLVTAAWTTCAPRSMHAAPGCPPHRARRSVCYRARPTVLSDRKLRSMPAMTACLMVSLLGISMATVGRGSSGRRPGSAFDRSFRRLACRSVILSDQARSYAARLSRRHWRTCCICPECSPAGHTPWGCPPGTLSAPGNRLRQ
jgi:hypothetical protein